jgi:hypothetical protein
MPDSPPSKRGFLHWLVVVVLGVIVWAFVFGGRNPWRGMVEPREQRAVVFKKIEAGGGWSAFKTECSLLISQTRTSGLHHWSSSQGGSLPVSSKIIPSLKPCGVYVYAVGDMPDYVDIMVMSDNFRRGHLTQSYSLIYQQTTNSDRCFAEDSFQRPELYRFKKVADSVFEAYLR